MRLKFFIFTLIILLIAIFPPLNGWAQQAGQSINTKSVVKMSISTTPQFQNTDFLIVEDSLKLPIKLVEVLLDGQPVWLKESQDIQNPPAVKDVVFWQFDETNGQLTVNISNIKAKLLPSKPLVLKIAPINRRQSPGRLKVFTAQTAQPSSQELSQEYRNVNIEIQ